MPFSLTLRDLHNCTFGTRWALQRCACLPVQSCLLSRSCSSVQTFVVSLTSLHGSLQTSLRLTNAYRRYPHRIRDFHSLDFLQLLEELYIYLPFKAHTCPKRYAEKGYIRESAQTPSAEPSDCAKTHGYFVKNHSAYKLQQSTYQLSYLVLKD